VRGWLRTIEGRLFLNVGGSRSGRLGFGFGDSGSLGKRLRGGSRGRLGSGVFDGFFHFLGATAFALDGFGSWTRFGSRSGSGGFWDGVLGLRLRLGCRAGSRRIAAEQASGGSDHIGDGGDGGHFEVGNVDAGRLDSGT
jgi:hypothetical protein